MSRSSRCIAGFGGLWLGLSLLVSCQDPNVIRVATDARQPPLSFLDDHDQLVGFEIDLFEAIAQKNHWKTSWQNVPKVGLFDGIDWDGLLSGLSGHRYDAVISNQVSTSDLRITWGVSQPYLNAGPVLVVPIGQKLADLGSLRNSWVGTVAQPSLDETLLHYHILDDSLLHYRSVLLALQDLGDHRVSGIIAPLAQVSNVLRENELIATRVQIVQLLSEEYPLAIVVRPDDETRLAHINDALAQLKAEGQVNLLRRRWKLAFEPTVLAD